MSQSQRSILASPLTINGRQVVVKEKRSTNSRVNNRVRFSAERGYGFRNEGNQGRGNYGSNRGYSRGDFNGRTEFGNRGGNNRGGFSNRGADGGYQRDDDMGSDDGGRTNCGVGLLSMEQPKLWHPGYLLLLDKP